MVHSYGYHAGHSYRAVEMVNMDKKEARAWIKTLIAVGMPVHPNEARQLYKDAELPLPKHLEPSPPLTGKSAELLKELERQLFGDPMTFRNEYMGVPVMGGDDKAEYNRKRRQEVTEHMHWGKPVLQKDITAYVQAGHSQMLREYDAQRTRALFTEPSGEFTGLQKEIERHDPNTRTDTRTDI